MRVEPETKLCPECGEDRPLTEVSQDRRRKDGRAGWCKMCVRRAARRQKGSEVERPEEFPDDLREATLNLAWQELYARLHDPVAVAEISTHTLAKIVCDLSRLELARGVPPDEEAIRQRQVSVLQMVDRLPPQRQLEVLRMALPDAEDPEPIRRAIAELEARGDGARESAGQ